MCPVLEHEMPFLPSVDPNVTTAVAAAGGAILIKIVERWLNRRNDNSAEAERIRKELREEVNRLRADNIRLERDADEWRAKYWSKKRLYDSDEIRINDLESEVSGGVALIRSLNDKVEGLEKEVKKLQFDDEVEQQ